MKDKELAELLRENEGSAYPEYNGRIVQELVRRQFAHKLRVECLEAEVRELRSLVTPLDPGGLESRGDTE